MPRLKQQWSSAKERLNFLYANGRRKHYERKSFIHWFLRACRITWDCCAGISAAISTTVRASKKIEALVDKAAALVNSKGKAAFAEFRKEGSEWWFGETYLFAYDMNLNVLLVAAFPENEGKNQTGKKDSNGKLYHDEFVKVVQSKGSGWVDYMFPKPGQTQPSQKWSYVKAVKVDGVPALIGAGFYPE
jgi:cytochrome c